MAGWGVSGVRSTLGLARPYLPLAGLPSACHVEAVPGVAGRGVASPGLVWRGLAGFPVARSGGTWHGGARRGSPLLIEASPVMARRGGARPGEARLGMAPLYWSKSCHGLSWLVRSRLGGARLPFRVKAGCGRAWPGAAWRGMAPLSAGLVPVGLGAA